MKKRDLSPNAPLVDRRSVILLEYALVSGLLFGVIFLGFHEVAGSLSNEFSNIGNSIAVASGS